ADGQPMGAYEAAQRARLEPVVEIFQHKGASETSPRWATEDEWADFELLDPDAARTSFAREGLKEGLRIAARVGVNPFAFGMIASTDTHNGTPGAVSEDDFRGHWGLSDDLPAKRLSMGAYAGDGALTYNPGGLVAVWARDNTRAAIFEALVRREVYGTSGPRIRLQVRVGSDLPASADAMRSDPAAIIESGAPM